MEEEEKEEEEEEDDAHVDDAAAASLRVVSGSAKAVMRHMSTTCDRGSARSKARQREASSSDRRTRSRLMPVELTRGAEDMGRVLGCAAAAATEDEEEDVSPPRLTSNRRTIATSSTCHGERPPRTAEAAASPSFASMSDKLTRRALGQCAISGRARAAENREGGAERS